MPRNKKFSGDMTAIGEVRTPVFAQLPDWRTLFAERHKRFTRLQPTSPVADYIGFLAGLMTAQQQTADSFVGHKAFKARAAALSDAPVPLDRTALIELPVMGEILDELLRRLNMDGLPLPLAQAVEGLQDRQARPVLLKALIHGMMPVENLPQAVLAMAAIQVLMTLATRQLAGQTLRPAADNRCPACGGSHMASLLEHSGPAEGTRFCACLYCGTQWHYVRIKCTFCEATGGIEYREIEGGPGSILAETCKHCGRYCKQIDRQKDAALNVFADDIGSIALDLMLREDGVFQRGAFNPFMAGY